MAIKTKIILKNKPKVLGFSDSFSIFCWVLEFKTIEDSSKIDESKELVDQFFNEFYNKSKDDVEFKTEEVETEEAPQEKSEDVQVTFNEVLKWFSQDSN